MFWRPLETVNRNFNLFLITLDNQTPKNLTAVFQKIQNTRKYRQNTRRCRRCDYNQPSKLQISTVWSAWSLENLTVTLRRRTWTPNYDYSLCSDCCDCVVHHKNNVSSCITVRVFELLRTFFISFALWSSEHTPAGRWAALFPSWAAGQRMSPSITAALEVQAARAPTAAPVELTLPGDGSSGRPWRPGPRDVTDHPRREPWPLGVKPAHTATSCSRCVCVTPRSRGPGGNGVWY